MPGSAARNGPAAYAGVSPHVEYTVAPLGQGLNDIVEQLVGWAADPLPHSIPSRDIIYDPLSHRVIQIVVE